MSHAPSVISVAEHAGWAHLVCVATAAGVPAVIERRRVSLIDGDLPRLPYHHDTVGMREEDANAIIARVRRSVATHTSRELQRILTDLAPAYTVSALAIREPPFPRLPDSVADVRASYQLQCAADGMLYQFALCHAAEALGLEVHRCRRGREVARAAERFGVTPGDIESFVRDTGRPPGAPWTEEHRRAFAAGMAVLPAHARAKVSIPRATLRIS
jgi:hypothetical protein